MEASIILSPGTALAYRPKEMWKTPVRATIRAMRRDGKSYNDIVEKTGLKRSTIQGIVKGISSRTTRKGKATKPRLLKQADIKRIFRFVSLNWTNRTKS